MCIRDRLIVANIDRVPDMDRTEKERLKAEAKAMVAVYYAHMLRHYGGLPIICLLYTS